VALDHADKSGRTPAHFAARGHLESLQCLAECGVALNHADEDGRTPAHFAAEGGHLWVLKYLAERGVALDHADKSGRTPAHFAARGHLESLQCLAECGVALNHADEDGCTPAHFAVMRGQLQSLQYLVEAFPDSLFGAFPDILFGAITEMDHDKLGDMLLSYPGLVHAATSSGETLLHIAAKAGRQPVAKVLVEAGAPIGLLNDAGYSAIQLAKWNRHKALARYLEKSRGTFDMKGGSGRELKKALKDRRTVTEVEWLFIPLGGPVKLLGGRHSMLAITVRSGADTHRYVIEKAADDPGVQVPKTPEDIGYRGVFLSKWQEVARGRTNISAFRRLAGDQIGNADLTMRHLFHLAVGPEDEQNDYDVGTNNCHHMAFTLFNHCAAEGFKLSFQNIPDRTLTDVARVLKSVFGLDVARSGGKSRIKISDVNISDMAHWSSESQVAERMYDRTTRMRMSSNTTEGEHQHAHITAVLSDWVYEADPDKLPQLLPRSEGSGAPRVLNIKVQQGANSVQWAIVKVAATIFVVFKGTDSFRDCVVNAMFSPFKDPRVRLSMHTGMWTAMHPGEVGTVDEIQMVLDTQETEVPVVLCGHSLGGGYALLAALDLHSSYPQTARRVKAVVTHGAPQVVIPPRLNDPQQGRDAWSWLNELSIGYVNAFDMIPRLPSCEDWVKKIVPRTPRLSGRTKKWDLFPHKLAQKVEDMWPFMKDYRPVGKLMFVDKQHSGGTKVWCSTLEELWSAEERQSTQGSVSAPGAAAEEAEGAASGLTLSPYEALCKMPSEVDRFVIEHHREYKPVTKPLMGSEGRRERSRP